MDSDLQFGELMKLITKTASDLDLSESTAAILLVKYQWNTAQLYADFAVLSHCVRETQTVELYNRCSLCDIYSPCTIINCGHRLCAVCFGGSMRQQMAANMLILKCPSPVCNKYLNFKNLPDNLQQVHLAGLQIDLLKKRSLGGQCVTFVSKHKYAFATGFFSLGYALYLGFSWRKEIGYGVKMISIGSEVKAKASALKNLVASSSKSFGRIFHG